SLGGEAEKVQVTGNIKFDLGALSLKFDAAGLRLTRDEQLLDCGSTHPGEEEIILKVYQRIIKEYPCLRLLIASRHPERAVEIQKIVQKYGFTPVRTSQSSGATAAQKKEVFILDTVGELISYYAIADIVFVGGSLVKTGGHNILEPASLEKPILFGPHMFNFRDIAELFLSRQAAIMVHTPEELGAAIIRLLNNNKEAQALAGRARALLLENRGATQRCIEYIRKAVVSIPGL
ncbi:MAG: 3-deoxy-D-manno-octulosonic acid transferase, partial [Candidatus Omnitrophica bacterium]|nr:3-deoxy-D-manno-octulosonic acid transferase [Candidatus Omnitrophota bacterium]